jgi:hypothetical protein
MKLRFTHAILALSPLAALGYVAYRPHDSAELLSGAESTPAQLYEGSPKRRGAPATPSRVEDHQIAPHRGNAVAQDEREIGNNEVGPAVSHNSTGVSIARSGSAVAPADTPQVATDYAESPRTMIDQPFRASDSIMKKCNPDPNSPWTCARLNELLPRLAKEPRDDAWATMMERKLRDRVQADGREFEIRALECRSTVCAVECASIHGVMRDLSYEFSEDNHLSTAEHFWAYEKGPDSSRVTVTLGVYTRD